MGVKVRFECGREDRVSGECGPFDFVQLTYENLRVENEGGFSDFLATFDKGDWHFTPEARFHGVDTGDRKLAWSDVVIFGVLTDG